MRIYLCPALMDALMLLVIFAVMYRAGEQGLSITKCAWLAGLFQMTYMLGSLATGFLLTHRNTRGMLLVSTVLCTVCGVTCLMMQQFAATLISLGAFGICIAVFFNSFQAVMRADAAHGSLARSIGLYTLAWSSGCGAGILFSGFSYRLGFQTLSALTILAGIVMLVVLLKHRSRPSSASYADERVEHSSQKAPPVDPTYVWIGWIMMCTAMVIQRPMHNFFPVTCAKSGVSAFATSLPLFLQVLIQAIGGFAMIRWRPLLYRRTPLWIMHVMVIAITLAMWRWPSFSVCFVGLSLAGIYMAFVFFCGVYYASNSGKRALNIGINEFLVGLGSVAGLFACEWVMKRTGKDTDMYLVMAAALSISLLAQLAVTGLFRKTPTPAQTI